VEAEQADAKSKTALVADAWTAYLAHHKKRWGARHMADHLNLSQAGGEPRKRGNKLTVAGVLRPLLTMRMADISAAVLIDWQAKEAESRANNARQGFEMFRAFWRWCASRPEYAAIVDTAAVENKDLRAEVPSRKSKKFDVLQRAQLPAWFAAVRGLGNPVISAYLQGLLLTGARRGLARMKDMGMGGMGGGMEGMGGGMEGRGGPGRGRGGTGAGRPCSSTATMVTRQELVWTRLPPGMSSA